MGPESSRMGPDPAEWDRSRRMGPDFAEWDRIRLIERLRRMRPEAVPQMQIKKNYIIFVFVCSVFVFFVEPPVGRKWEP